MSFKLQISAFELKIIALLSMFSDHIYKFLYLGYLNDNLKFTTTYIGNYQIFYYFGRIAFPIYSFQLIEGFFYTKNLKKYYLRLFFLAICSTIPFSILCDYKLISLKNNNVIWTLLLGLITTNILYILYRLNLKICIKFSMSIFYIVLIYYIANKLNFDYGGNGILIILIFFYAKFIRKKVLSYLLEFIFLIIISINLFHYQNLQIYHIYNYTLKLPVQWISILSLIPIWLYRGNIGYSNLWWKKFYYCFYPFHMLIIILVRYLIFGFLIL